MDKARFSAIAHRDHTYCSPVSEAKLREIVELLDLPPQSTVLDIGCGKGEILRLVVERWTAKGLGIDSNPFMFEQAKLAVHNRRITIKNQSLADLPASEPFDLVMCIGADAAFGNIQAVFEGVQPYAKPGGLVLVAVGFWRRPPSPDYLAALGGTEDEMTTHLGNVMLARASGLTLLYSAVSSEDDWDHYEGLYLRGVEKYVLAHPEDPEGPEMLERIRDWYETYLTWGRDTLGFAFYLLRKEPA